MTETPIKAQLIPQVQVSHPQTPRSACRPGETGTNTGNLQHSSRLGTTPSFSFGLGFLPSFQLGSPRNLNLMSVFSPQRFFLISNNLSKAIEGNNTHFVQQLGHRRKLLEGEVEVEENVFNSFNPLLTGRPEAKFLESLASENSRKTEDDAANTDMNETMQSHSTTEDHLDLWTINQHSLSSIYEENSSMMSTTKARGGKEASTATTTFLTPDKLFLSNSKESTIKTSKTLLTELTLAQQEEGEDLNKKIQEISDDKPEQSQPPADMEDTDTQAETHQLQLVKDELMDEGKENFVTKKRKTSFSPDSPSAAIASQIETIASPRGNSSRRKLSVVSNASTNMAISSTEHLNKSWDAELDDVLLNSYHKYRTLKENQPESSILKKASQNKVLSRMIQSKCGVLKSPQQIASRLSKLLRKLSFVDQLIPAPERIKLEETKEYFLTPMNKVVEKKCESTSNSAIIDTASKEVDLSSSPIGPEHSFAALKSSPIISEAKDKPAFEISPKELTIEFDSRNNVDTHVFSKFEHGKNNSGHPSRHSMTVLELQETVCPSMRGDLKSISKLLIQKRIPVWEVNHSVAITKDNTFTPNSSASPFTSTPTLKNVNLEGGTFKSFLKLNVKKENNKAGSNTASFDEPCILNWRCKTQIWQDNRVIHKIDEYVNGYGDGQKDSFELQIPFLRNFWSGFLTFLSNGGENNLNGLIVSQVIYENDNIEETSNFDFEDSSNSVRGYLIHHFKLSELYYGRATFNMVKLTQANGAGSADEEDDNATVLAESSPYKSSPKLDHIRTAGGPNKDLKVDVSRAHSVIAGPASAPIYNAQVVNKLNQDSLKQQEKIRMQVQIQKQIHMQSNQNSPQLSQFLHHQQQQQNFNDTPPLAPFSVPGQAFQNSQTQPQIQESSTFAQHPMLTASQSTGNIHQFLNHPGRQTSPNLNVPAATIKINHTGSNLHASPSIGSMEYSGNQVAPQGAQPPPPVQQFQGQNNQLLPGHVPPSQGSIAANKQMHSQSPALSFQAVNQMQDQMHMQQHQQHQQQQPQQPPPPQPQQQMVATGNGFAPGSTLRSEIDGHNFQQQQQPQYQPLEQQHLPPHQHIPQQPQHFNQQHLMQQQAQQQAQQHLNQQVNQQHLNPQQQQQQQQMFMMQQHFQQQQQQQHLNQQQQQQQQQQLLQQQHSAPLQQSQVPLRLDQLQVQQQFQLAQLQFQAQQAQQAQLAQERKSQKSWLKSATGKLESKENKQREITFGPILEYDPLSQPGASLSKQTPNGPLENGTYRFPVNTQVSMYKPKRK